MNDTIKQFIEENIDEIENNEFDFMYKYLCNNFKKEDIGAITKTLMEADINPLKHLDYIPDYYFHGLDIENFTIPEHISNIGEGAFSNCFNLKQILLGPNVTSIKSWAFENCSALTNITTPQTYTLGKGVFVGCTNLESAVIGKTDSMVLLSTFKDCKSLREVTIPTGVSLGNGFTFGMFNGCNNLTIHYQGTKDEWFQHSGAEATKHINFICYCTDGVVNKSR